jgi:hypothetical protein
VGRGVLLLPPKPASVTRRSSNDPSSRKNEPTVTISGKQCPREFPIYERSIGKFAVTPLGTGSPSKGGRGAEPKETKHENRKHAFGCVLSGTFGRYVDITRLGATTSRVGGGRCTMSGSGRESISDRRRIRGYEGRARQSIQGLPIWPRLPSLVPCRLRNARSGRQPRQHPRKLVSPATRRRLAASEWRGC